MTEKKILQISAEAVRQHAKVFFNTMIVIASKMVLKHNRSNEEYSKMQRKCEEGKGSEGTDQEFTTVKYNHQNFFLCIVLDESTFYFV
ncbi:hypothetical protein ACJMK2_032047 [Sinanodonta woodiana]|uniref:Uncharacterized protein n=1 Tax=Sinanodonta woodiana TaxID=1069815 RepID=A0ABD3X2D7_SINWO